MVCGPPVCETRCGLILDEESTLWTCPVVQQSEDLAVELLPVANACNNFRNYTIRLVKTKTFTYVGFPTDLIGLTTCPTKTIWLAQHDPTSGLLVHELGHASDDCATAGHQGWDTNGYDDAVAAAKRRMQSE